MRQFGEKGNIDCLVTKQWTQIDFSFRNSVKCATLMLEMEVYDQPCSWRQTSVSNAQVAKFGHSIWVYIKLIVTYHKYGCG
jgi:hypothetical protein